MKNNKFRDDFDDDEYSNHHHASKKKQRRNNDDFEFEGGGKANKKCKQCAFKNECDQSNAQRCKRFTKKRDVYDDY